MRTCSEATGTYPFSGLFVQTPSYWPPGPFPVLSQILKQLSMRTDPVVSLGISGDQRETFPWHPGKRDEMNGPLDQGSGNLLSHLLHIPPWPWYLTSILDFQVRRLIKYPLRFYLSNSMALSRRTSAKEVHSHNVKVLSKG